MGPLTLTLTLALPSTLDPPPPAAGDGESTMNSRTTNPRWLAPVVLRDGRSSRASDVFSFAIIMWEMLTWQIPYTGYFSLQVRGVRWWAGEAINTPGCQGGPGCRGGQCR